MRQKRSAGEMTTIGLMILGGVIYVAGVLNGMTVGWSMAHEQSPVLSLKTKEAGDG